jgi:tetratricopeptide (TPR) repeat protein
MPYVWDQIFFILPMDNLDKYSAVSIVLLIILSTILIFYQVGSGEADHRNIMVERQYAPPNPELKKKVQIASALMENGKLDKATVLIEELVSQFPYDGSPYMMLGDLRIRQQAPLEAMLAFREAVDLNPDYLDKKAPDFQGKKIKNTVNEARHLIEVELNKKSADKELRSYRKTVYYMLRKLAGSCG